MQHLREYIKSTEITIIFTFALYLITPVLAPYLKSIGFNDVNLSILFSLLPLAAIIISPIIGKISDDIGRNNIILFGVIIEILALILYSIGYNSITIVIARIFDAIAVIIVTILTLSKVEDSVDNKTRGKFTGISLSIQSAAIMIAPPLGGFIADYFFTRAPFIVSIFILIILAVFINKITPKQKNKKIPRKDFNLFAEIKEFLSFRKLKGMAILGIVHHATTPAIILFLPILITQYMGLSFLHVGIAYAVLNATHILQFIFGKWSDKNVTRVIIIGSIICAIPMIFISQAITYTILLLLLFLKGIGNSMWNISAWTLMSKIGENKKLEGEITGSYFSIAKIGSFISYVFSGIIVMSFGIESLFIANGGLLLIGSITAYYLIRDQKK